MRLRHGILQGFAGCEFGDVVSGEFDCFAGLWITGDTGSPVNDFPGTEADNVDGFTLLQAFCDGVENGVECGAGGRLCKGTAISDGGDEFGLVHDEPQKRKRPESTKLGPLAVPTDSRILRDGFSRLLVLFYGLLQDGVHPVIGGKRGFGRRFVGNGFLHGFFLLDFFPD